MKLNINRTIKAMMLAIAAVSSTPLATADEYWDRKTSLFELLPIKSDDIVFLGNSITDGGEFNELFGMDNIKNRGISSDIITGVEKRINQITPGQPRKIFLLIGINDVSHGHNVAKLAERYERLVKKIREQSPETQLYVQSVMPVNNSFNRYKSLRNKENTLKQFNKEIESIAARNGATYIDLWPFLSDANGNMKREYTNDGLHLNGNGYKAWAAGIEKFVKK
ncbi:MAG: GDSL-type esterase/lipase family protein [Candidatus Amulumruptor caecigallinarius]|nr:GDSL-type esterase/lipase family protein [Candidatus Amulumruptor caecigallinarius]